MSIKYKCLYLFAVSLAVLAVFLAPVCQGAVLSTFPGGTVSTFTGDTPATGLDFDGTYVYAANLGGRWNNQDLTIGNAVFNHDASAEGVTVTGTGAGFSSPVALGVAPSYAVDTSDLDELMHSGYSTWGQDPSISLSMAVVPGQWYKLHLLFSEYQYKTPNERIFDISVEGATIVEDFTAIPAEAVWTTAPHTGVMVTYEFTATDSTLNIDLTTKTSWLKDNPFIQAIALETIPEPSSAALLLIGLGFVVRVSRRHLGGMAN